VYEPSATLGSLQLVEVAGRGVLAELAQAALIVEPSERTT